MLLYLNANIDEEVVKYIFFLNILTKFCKEINWIKFLRDSSHFIITQLLTTCIEFNSISNRRTIFYYFFIISNNQIEFAQHLLNFFTKLFHIVFSTQYLSATFNIVIIVQVSQIVIYIFLNSNISISNTNLLLVFDNKVCTQKTKCTCSSELDHKIEKKIIRKNKNQ